MLKTRIKVFMTTLVVCVSIFTQSPAHADKSTDLLQQIANNTYQLLIDFDAFAQAWLKGDDSDETATLQTDLSSYMDEVWKITDTQLTIQPQLLDYYFGGQNTAPAYVNDLTYTTLLGQPYINETDNEKMKTSALNYTQYAAALNIQHAIPSSSWSGSKQNIANYENFYKTISAVQTFNAYVLSQFYANYANGLKLTDLQNNLKTQASSSDWFTRVAGEDIGYVLRQNLMYTSQLYLLLMQMLETQNQLLASSAMSNSLIVLGNTFNENVLLNKALGKSP